MRIRLIAFLLLIRCLSYSQACAPGGTVLASINGTMSLCPPPPPFVTALAYEVCASGVVIDTCGGNASRYYFINIGGDVTLKAFQSCVVQIKPGGKLNITGGANLIKVASQPGAILTGIPPGTLVSCPALYAPSGATCYVSEINSLSNPENNTSVYPNPFMDKITITAENNSFIQIYNSIGELISESKIENEKTEIDLDKEAKGIYFLRTGSTIKKLIKE